MTKSSIYGAKFDALAVRWANLEAEHDEVHPDRSDCGGVGVCPMMRQAHGLEELMGDEMDEWRLRR